MQEETEFNQEEVIETQVNETDAIQIDADEATKEDTAGLLEQKVSFTVTENKEVERDGHKYGVIVGYASTHYNVDRVNDIVMKGAFNNTIERHRKEGRPIRMYYQHDNKELIGGFDAFQMSEDERGLKVVGEINLEVQRGREVYALAKQGVLTDMSIGYAVKDFEMKQGVRQLVDIELWEISMVSEPCNPEARIQEVKKEHCSMKEVKSAATSKRSMERLLRDSGFSRQASVFLVSLMDYSSVKETQRDAGAPTAEDILTQLGEIKTLVQQL